MVTCKSSRDPVCGLAPESDRREERRGIKRRAKKWSFLEGGKKGAFDLANKTPHTQPYTAPPKPP
jgi:hypothetical protein